MNIILEFENFLKQRHAQNIKEKLIEFESYITHPKHLQVVSDEIIDFLDIKEGKPTRFESFARYIETRYDVNKYNNVLEVGCGPTAELAKELIKRNYNVTCIDKVVIPNDDFKCIKELFDYRTFDVNEYDLIVGLEPCEATEHILLGGLKNNKPFVISLCYSPHDSIDGKKFENYVDWDNYLIEKSNGKAYIDQRKVLGQHHRILRNK